MRKSNYTNIEIFIMIYLLVISARTKDDDYYWTNIILIIIQDIFSGNLLYVVLHLHALHFIYYGNKGNVNASM